MVEGVPSALCASAVNYAATDSAVPMRSSVCALPRRRAASTSARRSSGCAAEGCGKVTMPAESRGLPSPVAFPLVTDAYDGFVTLTDDEARAAADELQREGVPTTTSGAAGLGGLRSLDDRGRAAAGIGPDSSVLVVNTEGDTTV